MSEAFIVRRGGGGGGLNFRVVGGTSAPTNPKENDIWVNTDVEITGWAVAPAEPNGGQVTIECSTGVSTVYIGSDGSETYYPATIATDYANLQGAAKITVNNPEDLVTENMYHAFYDANKTLLSTVERQAGTTTYDVPAGAAYVRLTVYSGRDTMSFTATLGVESGFVWIQTGPSSSTPFNALKKNNLTVYPVNCVQYISGAWVGMEAKTYQAGAWVDWTTWLYNMGDTCAGLTGGWKFVEGTTGVGTFYSDYMYLGYTGGTNRYVTAYTENKINTNEYTTLNVDVDVLAVLSGYGLYCGVSNQKTGAAYSDSLAYTKTATTGRQTLTFDLTSYQGEYYISLSSSVAKANIYKVWLE